MRGSPLGAAALHQPVNVFPSQPAVPPTVQYRGSTLHFSHKVTPFRIHPSDSRRRGSDVHFSNQLTLWLSSAHFSSRTLFLPLFTVFIRGSSEWVLGGVDVKRQGLGLFRVQHYDEVPVNYQLLDCSALPAVVLQPPL